MKRRTLETFTPLREKNRISMEVFDVLDESGFPVRAAMRIVSRLKVRRANGQKAVEDEWWVNVVPQELDEFAEMFDKAAAALRKRARQIERQIN